MATAEELTIDTSATALDMAQTIFGSGVQVVSATYTGDPNASGIYTDANSSIPGVTNSDSGVILSTGNAVDFTNSGGSTDTNLQAGTGVDNAGVDGDIDMNGVSGQSTFDGAILEAEFIPTGDYLTMQFVFTSEEYPEYVLLNVNDSFGVWVNGQFVEATITTSGNIAIDTVNQNSNQNLYQDNTADQFNTEMDGITYTLSFKAPVNAGEVNTIKIGIADGGDTAYDSNVLIAADSIQTVALAFDDTVQMTANSTRTVDVLANDRDLQETGLTITHVMGQPISVGQTVTIGTGEQVTLNADGTLTVTSDGDVGSNVITYSIVDGAGNTDVGYLTIVTTPSPAVDGVVQGTTSGDLIDASYLGDPDGDMVDNSDATGIYGTVGEDDYILAGAGNDTVLAGLGNDSVFADDGDDSVEAGDGDDEVLAGAGNDTVYGGAGNDAVLLQAGDDVFGTFGADSAGDDTVYGGSGNDAIISGAGDDRVDGGAGNDTLSGGIGSDTILGGDDQDYVNITDDHQNDTIDGGEGGVDADTIWFGNFTTTSGVSVTLTGTEAGTYDYFDTDGQGTFTNVEAFGLTVNNDSLDGSAADGPVSVYGHAGDDTITGGAGSDYVDGGQGDDLISGNAGSDSLVGGDGNDTISAGPETLFAEYTTLSGTTQTVTGTNGNTDFDHSVVTDGAAVDFLTVALEGGLPLNGYHVGNGADANEVHTHSFTQEVAGASLTLVEIDPDETVVLWLDGVAIDLNDAISSGLVTFDPGTTGFFIDASGAIAASTAPVFEPYPATLIINQPFTTLTVQNVSPGGGGNGTIYSLDVNTNPATVLGLDEDSVEAGAGDDVVSTGSGNDMVDAGTGNDTVDAGLDNDSVDGGDGDDSLWGNEGDDLLQGGAGNDIVEGGEGQDQVLGGLGQDTLWGGGGNDVLTDLDGATDAQGGDGDDTITTGAADDTILGDSGFDSIAAGAGNDSVDGGFDNDTVLGEAGNDTLTGGDGDDLIYGGDDRDAITAAANDTVVGGEGGNDLDTLYVNDVASVIFGGGNNEAGTINFNDGSTMVFSEIEQLVVDGVPYSIADGIVHGTTAGDTMGVGYTDAQGDIIDGADGLADTILGDDGNDEIHAGEGNDSVEGGTGDDTLFGDLGDDTVQSGSGADAVAGGDGADSLQNAGGYDTVYGGAGDDSVSGAGIVFGEAGNDLIDFTGSAPEALPNQADGGAGNDTVTGGDATDEVLFLSEGTDSFTGGGNTAYGDWVSARDLTQGASIDISTGTATFAGNTTSFTGVEGAQGSDFNDTLTGDAAANQIIGGVGNDLIVGGDGADSLWGDDDADTIFGGAGDVVQGGEGGTDNDRLVLNFADVESIAYGGGDNEAGTVTFYGGGTLTFTEIETIAAAGLTPDGIIWGTSGAEVIGAGYIDANGDITDNNDAILSNPGSDDDEIYALDGNDTIQSLLGDDRAYGGTGDDLVQTGVGNDYAQGDEGNDTVEGGDGDDFLRGDAGNDSVYGGDGNDSVYGGADTDQVFGGAGNDQIFGGFGTDTVYGGDGDDTVTGSGQSDEVNGDAGNDFLQGSDGNDTLYGGLGDDTLLGEEDADTFYAGAGDYVDGYETVTTGTDNDSLYVTGVQSVVFDAGNDENGTITFTDGGTLQFFNIENLYVDGVPVGVLDYIVEGTGGADVVDGTYAGDPEGDLVDAADNATGTNDDVIETYGGNDSVSAGDGNDLVYGGAGDDVLQGDDGNDTLYGEDGNDALFSVNGQDVVYGGAGDDTAYASQDGDLVYGGDGNDRLTGGGFASNGHDTLHGDAGNDTLAGNLGNDQLYGGADADQLQILINVDNDTIQGGETGLDVDRLDMSAVTSAGVTVTYTANEAGTVTDGAGVSVFSEIEQLVLTDLADSVDGAASTQDLFITAGAGNDTLFGGAGDDSLLGGDDADHIYGGAGDLVEGGEGGLDNDTLVLNLSDVQSITYGGADDEAGTVTFYGGGTLSFAEIENIAYAGPVDGTSGDDTMSGGYTDINGDQVDGSDGDDDTILGFDGNDQISAGAGNDTVYGGTGNDSALGGVANDVLYGEDGNDTLGGDSGLNQVYGGAGADRIVSGGGDDTVYGGEGGSGDTGLPGELGDTLTILTTFDATVVFTGEEAGTATNALQTTEFHEIETIATTFGNDVIDASVTTGGHVLSSGAGNDTVIGGTGNDSIEGEAGNDSLTAGAGDDTLAGGDGDDRVVLTDGFGSDVIVGGEGAETTGDVLDLSGLTTGVVVDLTSANAETGSVTDGSGTASFTEIETIILGGGVDTLVLADGSGSDAVQGFAAPTDNGDGTFTGIDQLDVSGLTDAGGQPVNTADVVVTSVNISSVTSAVLTFPDGSSIRLTGVAPPSSGVAEWLEAMGIPAVPLDYIVEGSAGDDVIDTFYTADPEGDQIDSFDAADGSNNDLVEAYGGNDLVQSGGGNDTVYAGDGDDTVSGGIGTDLVYGGAGNDQLNAGSDGDDTLHGEDGNDSLVATVGNDQLYGGTGDDTLTSGAGNDLLSGGDGVDSLYGGTEDDTLLGGIDNDQLYGGSGNDSLEGGDGDDLLHGGPGIDTLTGGAGNDTLVGRADSDEMLGGDGDDVFTIDDAPGSDQITGGETVETTGDVLDASATTLDTVLDLSVGNPGDPEDGRLIQGADQVSFSEIESILLGSGNDSVIGSTGDDAVSTGAGADTVDGGAGNDIFALGADGVADLVRLADGSGDDTLAGFDAPTDNGDGTFTGIDQLDVSGLTDAGGDPVNVADVFVTDTGSDTTLTFPDGTVVTLVGVVPPATNVYAWLEAMGVPALGPDYIVEGSAGADTIDGTYLDDPEGDLIDAADNQTGTNGDLVEAYGGNDSVLAGDGNDSVYAGADDDSVLGEAGDDSLLGEGGNDTLDGGDGNDSIYGGAGNDSVVDGEGDDVVDGGDGDDFLDGPGNDTYYGGAGNDTINAGTGNDLVYGGTDNDNLNGEAGNDTIYGDAGNDNFIGGAGNDTEYGGSGDDSMGVGDTGNDLVYGGTGNDVLSGDLGNDTVYGDDGNDAIEGHDGVDFLYGGAGEDYLAGFDVTGITNPVNRTLNPAGFDDASNDVLDGGDGNDTLLGGLGDDTLLGGADQDTLLGGTGNDSLNGGTGNDQVDGGDGTDTLLGDLGDDSLTGGLGDDYFEAGDGDDSLYGGDGNDAMNGNAGNDVMDGGAGNDAFDAGDGDDTLYGGSGMDDLRGVLGNDSIYGGDDNDRLLGAQGNDTLYGDAGDDSVDGGAGNDTLYGGAGADTIIGGDDRDRVIIGAGEGDGSVVDGSEGGDDYDVLDLSAWGQDNVNIIYGGGNNEAGTVEFLDAGGATIGTMTFSNIEKVIPCFTPGTLIATDRGEVPVETLVAGDRVLTRDNGYQVLQWIGQRDLTANDLALAPNLIPVCIGRGALGPNLPERDLVVSPQHRMLMSSTRAELLFGEHEVLVAATHLLGQAGVALADASAGVSYVHLLFDQHEIIRANGSWSESYQPGEMTLAGMEDGPRNEVLDLFPELRLGFLFPAARATLKKHEAKLLFTA